MVYGRFRFSAKAGFDKVADKPLQNQPAFGLIERATEPFRERQEVA